jgi:hypothetical protein
VAFWTDHWTNIGRLKEIFPFLYTFSMDITCTVASQNQDNAWVLDLHSQLPHTAQLQLQTLQLYLEQNHPQLNDNKDERALLTTRKKSTTRDFYKLFCNRGITWLPHKWIWIKAIPLRHTFFLWLAFHGWLNTKDNMTKN